MLTAAAPAPHDVLFSEKNEFKRRSACSWVFVSDGNNPSGH